MGESSRAVEVVDIYPRLIEQLPRGKYSTFVFPTTAVDPVAVKAVYIGSHSTETRSL